LLTFLRASPADNLADTTSLSDQGNTTTWGHGVFPGGGGGNGGGGFPSSAGTSSTTTVSPGSGMWMGGAGGNGGGGMGATTGFEQPTCEGLLCLSLLCVSV
jgi:hypothetical protein